MNTDENEKIELDVPESSPDCGKGFETKKLGNAAFYPKRSDNGPFVS